MGKMGKDGEDGKKLLTSAQLRYETSEAITFPDRTDTGSGRQEGGKAQKTRAIGFKRGDKAIPGEIEM